MKKWRLQIIVLLVALILLICSFFGWLEYPKNVFWQIAKPVGTVLNISFGRIPKFFINITQINRTLKQNSNLVAENLSLQSELAKLKEVAYENEILKKELKFTKTNDSDSTLMPSAIIGRTSGYLKSVTIDKGAKDGLQKGQAAISQGFLVGTVNQVRNDNAEVTLITDYNSLVPVVLQESRGTGLLRGGLGGLSVGDIPLNATIKEKEMVVTSGLGGMIPAGIAVGQARDTISRAGEIFQKISLDSPVDFSKLEVLFIVKI